MSVYNTNNNMVTTKKGILALKEEYEKELHRIADTLKKSSDLENQYHYLDGQKFRLENTIADLEELLK